MAGGAERWQGLSKRQAQVWVNTERSFAEELENNEAVKLYASPAFRIKLVLLSLAGLNALIFHRTIYRQAANWDTAPVAPPGARLAGLLSLILWICIIAAGRAIAYGPGYDRT